MNKKTMARKMLLSGERQRGVSVFNSYHWCMRKFRRAQKELVRTKHYRALDKKGQAKAIKMLKDLILA